MLRLKTVLKLKKTMRGMIHLRFEKKKHLTSARSTQENTSSQEDMEMKENHGYRNPCLFQVSLSKPKKKSTTISFCEWRKPLFLQIPLTDAISYLLTPNI